MERNGRDSSPFISYTGLELRDVTYHGEKIGQTIAPKHEIPLEYKEAIQKLMDAIPESHVYYEGDTIKIETVIHLR